MRLSYRIGLGFLLIALLAAVTFVRVSGAAAPISQDDYWRLVEKTREDIRALDGKSAGEVRATLDGLAGAWSDVKEVTLTDGTTVPVDESFFVSLLEADPPKLDQLDGLLGTLLAAHKSYPQKIFTAADLDPLHGILGRPEFQWKTNPVNDWFQKLWDKFTAWLDRLLNGVHVTIPGGSTIFTVIAVVLLLAVLAYVFRGLFTDLVKENSAGLSAEDDDRNLTAETAFQKAQNLSGQGDYRTAVRYLYLSSLLLMEERGILRYDRSRTNREYLRSVSSHPNLAKPLQSVVDVFDRVWYGFEPLDESTYKEYVNEVEELKEQKE